MRENRKRSTQATFIGYQTYLCTPKDKKTRVIGFDKWLKSLGARHKKPEKAPTLGRDRKGSQERGKDYGYGQGEKFRAEKETKKEEVASRPVAWRYSNSGEGTIEMKQEQGHSRYQSRRCYCAKVKQKHSRQLRQLVRRVLSKVSTIIAGAAAAIGGALIARTRQDLECGRRDR